MGRASMEIVLALICLNAAAGLLTASGVAAALDMQPNVGGNEAIDNANQAADNVQAGGGLGDTLFALYGSVTGTLKTIFEVLFYGPIMLTNLGLPSWVVTFLFAPATVVAGADIIYSLTGRDI